MDCSAEKKRKEKKKVEDDSNGIRWTLSVSWPARNIRHFTHLTLNLLRRKIESIIIPALTAPIFPFKAFTTLWLSPSKCNLVIPLSLAHFIVSNAPNASACSGSKAFAETPLAPLLLPEFAGYS